MSMIYVLIPLSVILMIFAIGFFFWAVSNGQFDDLDSPALDVLDDDASSCPATSEGESDEKQNP